ncbi:MAG: hypothetical protein AAB919_00655 [Patescibacteria group bacterium]
MGSRSRSKHGDGKKLKKNRHPAKVRADAVVAVPPSRIRDVSIPNGQQRFFRRWGQFAHLAFAVTAQSGTPAHR